MDRFQLVALVAVAGLAGGAVGCSPHIGDHCTINTDCSITGTLFCDTSQPNGYCTFFNCAPNACQDQAVCVLLHASVPGCAYDDYNSPARTGRTMCLKACQQDSDCRQGEGYVCADPTKPPWSALVIDSNQRQHVCMVDPDYDAGPLASYAEDAAVCQSSGPSVPAIDAGVNLEEAGADAGIDAPGEAETDAAGEAGDAEADAGDAGDAGAAGDAELDAGVDATVDASDASVSDGPSPTDAPDGG
jgi:hypothetical protein